MKTLMTISLILCDRDIDLHRDETNLSKAVLLCTTQEVTGKNFKNEDFRESLSDGILLCE